MPWKRIHGGGGPDRRPLPWDESERPAPQRAETRIGFPLVPPRHRCIWVNMNPNILGHPVLAVLGLPLFVPQASACVSAGFPSPAADHEEDGLDLSRRFIVHPLSTFVVRVAGCSMSGAGILAGDFLVVDRSRHPHDGDVVLAIVDGDFTTKRWRCVGPRQWLESAHASYPPIPWGDGCEVWGVVTSVHRDLMQHAG